MTLEIGVYAPSLDDDPQPAPLACLRNLFDRLSARNDIRVTHLHRAKSVDWDDSLRVSKVPGHCERIINKAGFDVVHFNTFVSIPSPMLLSSPSVLTYHGDVHWEFPGVFDSLMVDRARSVLESVKMPQYDSIVTVSSDLSTRVRNRYRFFDIKPTTIYNGIDHSRFQPTGPSILNSYDIDTPYVLHVSNYSKKKNPDGILRAFRRVRNQREVNLVICGGGWEDNDSVRHMMHELGIQNDITFTGYVPDKDLPALYRDAAVFLYPSLHESFGLPIVEAMACGTPVVTSNKYAPPEISGGAALLCDPESPNEIADAVLRLLENPSLSATLRKRGLERSNKFTWEAAAEHLLDVYSSL